MFEYRSKVCDYPLGPLRESSRNTKKIFYFYCEIMNIPFSLAIFNGVTLDMFLSTSSTLSFLTTKDSL